MRVAHEWSEAQTAAARVAALDGGPDDPSWDDLAQRIGIDLRPPNVGDLTGSTDLNLALYWPVLPPGCGEAA